MTSPPSDGQTNSELVDLDRALTKLAAQEPEKAELVKLRYFAGLSIDEAFECTANLSFHGEALLGFCTSLATGRTDDPDGRS